MTDHRVPDGFPFGVASGDPSTTSIQLWTRVDPSVRPASLSWHLWCLSPDARQPDVRTGVVAPDDIDADGFVRLTVDELTPGRRHEYRFTLDPEKSPTGSFTTLPDDGSAFRLAVVCCSRWPSAPFDVYTKVAEHQPDLVLHLGDYIYSDGGGGPRGPHRPLRACVEPSDYRQRYAQYRSDADLQRLHAAAGWVSVWDDHEFTDNAWSNRDDMSWRARRKAAETSYHKWMPQLPHGNGPTPLDRLINVPGILDLIIVDCRMAGRDQPEGSGGPVVIADDESRRLLTDEQWLWLESTIANSSAPWLVIATSVQFSPLRLLPVPALAWPPWRWKINADQWDGYPSERNRLLRSLDARAPECHTIVLSGDLHGRFLTRPSIDRRHITEITNPAVSAPTFAESIRRFTHAPLPTAVIERWLRLINPQIEELDLDHHGATIIDFDPQSWQITEVDADPRP